MSFSCATYLIYGGKENQSLRVWKKPPGLRNDAVGLGSAGGSPAVFGLWPETFCREPGEPFGPAFIREHESARRRLERPGRSRSPFLIESFRFSGVLNKAKT